MKVMGPLAHVISILRVTQRTVRTVLNVNLGMHVEVVSNMNVLLGLTETVQQVRGDRELLC